MGSSSFFFFLLLSSSFLFFLLLSSSFFWLLFGNGFIRNNCPCSLFVLGFGLCSFFVRVQVISYFLLHEYFWLVGGGNMIGLRVGGLSYVLIHFYRWTHRCPL